MENVDERSPSSAGQFVSAPADAALLDRFAAGHDETAFAVLVKRYGPLVLSVCRRMLRHEQDAEDAFQATFLVLVRKARSIRKREAVGSWLYGVAYRIARKEKARQDRLPVAESAVDIAAPDPAPEWLQRELRQVLDEEVNRLPDKYREAFVLCYLEGMTNEQAARQLGCPLGTVQSRLSRARERLRDRLAARHVAIPAGDPPAPLDAPVVPVELVEETARVAVLFVDAKPVLPVTALALAELVIPAASVHAVTLAAAYLRTLWLTKLTKAALVLLALLVAAGGLFFLLSAMLPNDRDRLQGAWKVTRTESGGKVLPPFSWKFVFMGEHFKMIMAKVESIPGAYHLDPSKVPKAIDLHPDPGQTWRGIYDMDGNTLRMCLNHFGTERPTAFVTQPGSRIYFYTFTRELPPAPAN